MLNLSNNVYDIYTDYFCTKLHDLLNKILDFRKYSYACESIDKIKCHLDLSTLKSSDYLDDINDSYLDHTYTSYYTVNVPIQFTLKNLQTFYINYNVINIPKITSAGDMILNGYCRVPVIYLKLSTKYSAIKINNIILKKYLIKLNYNLNLYINIYDNTKIDISLNSYKISNDLYELYNNIYIKNKYMNFTDIYNLIYILNFDEESDDNIFNGLLQFNEFYNYCVSIEIFSVVGRLINLIFNRKHIPDNDNLINKTIGSFLTFIFSSFGNYINRFNFIKRLYKSCITEKIYESFNISIFKENLILNPSLHYVNQLNILSYCINKFKINVFGSSSLQVDKAIIGEDIRKIQSDYIGYINIINTPDGDTCGLVSALANNTIIDRGKLKLINTSCNMLEEFTFIDIPSKQLDSILISDFSTVKKNKTFKVKTIEVLENNEFKLSRVDGVDNSKKLDLCNILSITELIIPFLFNNDPCRALMGSKMHTQALPLVYSESPYVVTKYNDFNTMIDSKYIYSLYNGVVEYVDNTQIIILDDKDRFIYFYLNPFNIIDYNSIVYYKPLVWEGENINIGKILAAPVDYINSEFTLGFNNLINYNFYNGSEHEDAVVINKNLLIDDILTSISFDVYENHLTARKSNHIDILLPLFYVRKQPNQYCPKKYRVINENNEYMVSGDSLSSKVRYELPKSKSKPFFKVFKWLFAYNRVIVAEDSNLRIDQDHEGRLIIQDVLSYSRFRSSDLISANLNKCYLTLRFFIFSINRINVGDKLCGRHGNKGVVSKIVDSIDLPYNFYNMCPYSITSPIGALARINLGQFFEGICGLSGLNFNLRLKAPINLYDQYLYSNLELKSLYNYMVKSNNIDNILDNSDFLRDFKTGYKLKNISFSTVAYYFKLMHTSKSKVQYRTIGNYNELTQQPHEGKHNQGGQKFGEMEIWALESHGASYNLRELSALKTNMRSFTEQNTYYKCSEAFKLLVLELKNVLININTNSRLPFTYNNLKENF